MPLPLPLLWLPWLLAKLKSRATSATTTLLNNKKCRTFALAWAVVVSAAYFYFIMRLRCARASACCLLNNSRNYRYRQICKLLTSLHFTLWPTFWGWLALKSWHSHTNEYFIWQPICQQAQTCTCMYRWPGSKYVYVCIFKHVCVWCLVMLYAAWRWQMGHYASLAVRMWQNRSLILPPSTLIAVLFLSEECNEI